MSINRVLMSGNLGRDPELMTTASGTQILSFSVAVTDRHKDKSTGEWTDYTNWVDCLVFGNRAPALADILHKGAKVAVDGKLRYSAWEAKDGAKRSKLEVVVDEVEFMSARGSDGPRQPRNAAPAYSAPTPAAQAPTRAQKPASTAQGDVYDDDIPF